MRVHLEGMGLQGSLLLYLLQQKNLANLELTWNDIDSPHTAWKASTGAIYPANSTKFGDDHACHQRWGEWHELGWFQPYLERCNFWFSQKSPPHGGKYRTHGGSEAPRS